VQGAVRGETSQQTEGERRGENLLNTHIYGRKKDKLCGTPRRGPDKEEKLKENAPAKANCE